MTPKSLILVTLLLVPLALGTDRPPVAQEETVVLEARPTHVVESWPVGTEHRTLTAEQREKNRVRIVKRGNRYFWTTRENRALVHVESGAYHHFIDPQGGGYVKVYDSRHPLAGGEEDPPIQFFEHVSLHLGTLTYWGNAPEFTL